MKYLAVLLFLFPVFLTKAQTKIGYINLDTIINVMPEKAALDMYLKKLEKVYQDSLTTLQYELQTTVSDTHHWTEEQRQKEELKLQQLQNKIENLQTTALQQLKNERVEGLKPIKEKVKLATAAIAKEKGFAYVFNVSKPIFLTAATQQDLTKAVKRRLGIK